MEGRSGGRWDGVLAIGSGLLVALAFPDFDWSDLAWVALVPFFWALRRASPGRAFRLGWLVGFVSSIATLYWVVNPIRHYTDAPVVVGLLALTLLAAARGVYLGVFAAVLRWASAGEVVALEVLAPSLWVLVEWFQTVGPLAFPWNALGYSLHEHRSLVQMVEVTSVYGLSALVVFANVTITECLAGLRRGGRIAIPNRGALLLLAGLLVGLPAIGRWRLDALARLPDVGAMTVGLVQGNVDQGRKWDARFQDESVDKHARLARVAKAEGADLVVWPETAVPFYFQNPGPERERLVDSIVDMDVDVLFGSPAFGFDHGVVQLFNRAYLVRRDGSVGGYYDKLRLVPFGEYVPFQSVLFFVRAIVDAVGSFAPGQEATVFRTSKGRFGVLICYEGTFPALGRRFVDGGADFLVNITNDAWFGRTSAPHQHLAMVTLRAVENRVPIVRAANTGITAVVDIDGSVRWQTGLFEAETRTDVIRWKDLSTFYTRYGDVFAGACALASLAGIGYGGARKRSRAAPGPSPTRVSEDSRGC